MSFLKPLHFQKKAKTQFHEDFQIAKKNEMKLNKLAQKYTIAVNSIRARFI